MQPARKQTISSYLSSKAEEARSLLTADDRMYRHEYKYLVSSAQIPVLRSRIAGLMQPDPNTGEDGMYHIRSVYFDDQRDRCFYDNETGVDGKAKYRIRIYNASDARIRLELKEGRRGKKFKTSDLLTRAQAEALISGDYLRGLPSPSGNDGTPPQTANPGPASPGTPPQAANPGPASPQRPRVLPGLCADIMTNRMRPAVIVEYDRVPYIYRYGNVRVTFDLNISSSQDFEHFFCPRIRRRPIMPAGMHLMEVKFDEFLPDAIYRGLQLEQLRQTTFSKYYLCRIYSPKEVPGR